MPHPPARTSILVPTLLGLAAVALAADARLDGASGRLAGGVAATAVLAAFGLACRGLGRAEAEERPATDWGPLLDRLDRIAAALESRPAPSAVEADPFALVATAIAERRWADADALLADHPGHPDAGRLAGEVASARRAEADGLRDELKAAQSVNDPVRSLEIHDRLAGLLDAEALAEVEAPLVKWLMGLVMKRLRGGTVGPDVAELAGRVADRFPRSVEGASLRASLPTLRRSAGLCPRCGRPYRGIADACPVCLGPPSAADSAGNEATPTPSPWDDPADDPPPVPSSPDEPEYREPDL